MSKDVVEPVVLGAVRKGRTHPCGGLVASVSDSTGSVSSPVRHTRWTVRATRTRSVTVASAPTPQQVLPSFAKPLRLLMQVHVIRYVDRSGRTGTGGRALSRLPTPGGRPSDRG